MDDKADDLLCDEVWTMSPVSSDINNHAFACGNCNASARNVGSTCTSKEDSVKAFRICCENELAYMPASLYADRLRSSESIRTARFKAFHWFLKSRRRLNLSFATVFNAANYFDRFVSSNQCCFLQQWNCWMVELLSVACLSIACKLCETLDAHLPLHEIQMEDLDHSFQPILIQRMELRVLSALEWRLISITSCSYIELLTLNITMFLNKPQLLEDLNARVTRLLLLALLDYKLLEFRPSIVATSAVRCILGGLFPSACDAHFSHLTALIPQDHKDELVKCSKIMDELVDGYLDSVTLEISLLHGPSSSPVTVLKMKVVVDSEEVNCSLFKIPTSSIHLPILNRKRKRGLQE